VAAQRDTAESSPKKPMCWSSTVFACKIRDSGSARKILRRKYEGFGGGCANSRSVYEWVGGWWRRGEPLAGPRGKSNVVQEPEPWGFFEGPGHESLARATGVEARVEGGYERKRGRGDQT